MLDFQEMNELMQLLRKLLIRELMNVKFLLHISNQLLSHTY